MAIAGGDSGRRLIPGVRPRNATLESTLHPTPFFYMGIAALCAPRSRSVGCYGPRLSHPTLAACDGWQQCERERPSRDAVATEQREASRTGRRRNRRSRSKSRSRSRSRSRRRRRRGEERRKNTAGKRRETKKREQMREERCSVEGAGCVEGWTGGWQSGE